MKIQKKYALVTSVLLGAVLVTTASCSSTHSMPSATSGAAADSSEMMDQGSGTWMDADVMFLQMMIPHHEQAVEMSMLAVTNGASPEVQKLADTIAAAQGPEIEQMRTWLDESGAGSMMGGHAGHMDGVLSDEAMSQLAAAQGADFDRLYLEGMIAHHEGAISMAQDVIDDGGSAAVVALAQKIIDAQTSEISQIKQMLGQ